MGQKIPYKNRERGITFMGIPFKKQTCPSCKTTYEMLAIGQDSRRNTLKCQYCDAPENFIEEDTDSED